MPISKLNFLKIEFFSFIKPYGSYLEEVPKMHGLSQLPLEIS